MCRHCCGECADAPAHMRCWHLHQINLGANSLWHDSEINFQLYKDLGEILEHQLDIDVDDLARVQRALAVRREREDSK